MGTYRFFFLFFCLFFLFPFSWHAWWLCAPLHWFYIDAHQFFPSLSHLRVPSVSKIPGMARLGLLQGGWVGGMFFKRQRQKGEGVFFLSPLDFSHFSPSLILKRCCAVDCHWSLIRECSYPASILVKHLSLVFFLQFLFLKILECSGRFCYDLDVFPFVPALETYYLELETLSYRLQNQEGTSFSILSWSHRYKCITIHFYMW